MRSNNQDDIAVTCVVIDGDLVTQETGERVRRASTVDTLVCWIFGSVTISHAIRDFAGKAPKAVSAIVAPGPPPWI